MFRDRKQRRSGLSRTGERILTETNAAGEPQLRRVIGLPMLVLYGTGTMLGAGIYVLVGPIAAVSGLYAPVAFLVAAVVVSFSALSYGELGARYPRSGGEAVYVHEAFGRPFLSGLTGWAIVATGVISSATMARGFIGYLQVFFPVPGWVAIGALVLVTGGVAAWGVRQSVWLAAIITFIEIAGLAAVIWVCRGPLVEAARGFDFYVPGADLSAWAGVAGGAFIAFYAFVGFEDMVNMAEEVRDPARTMPWAIVIALLAAGFLYVLVALAAVAAMPIAQLAESRAPFADLFALNSRIPPGVISAVSMVAIVNGALVQIVMGSRVCYGMSRQGNAPRLLGRINARTGTPLTATALVTLVVLVLALSVPLVRLAELTSFVILLVFALVNGALLVIQAREGASGQESRRGLPVIVPVLGLVCSLLFLASRMLAN